MAAKYRKIDPRIWKDERFRLLDERDKLIAVYCLTAQSNRVGIFNFSPGMMAEDLGIKADTCLTRLRHVSETMKWRWDECTRVLYFPRWWKYNRPENASVLIGCLSDLDDLPQTPLMNEFYVNTVHLPPHLLDTWRTRVGTRPPHQEQEQEQEQEREGAPAHAPKKPPFQPPTLEEVKAYCAERGNGVDPVQWYDHYTSNGWRVGRNPMRDWKAAVRTWERNGLSKENSNGAPSKTKAELRAEALEKNRRIQEQYGDRQPTPPA